MPTEQKCPSCGETVAAASVRCRECGLARREFEDFEARANAHDSESAESGGFQLGQMKPGSSTGFQLPDLVQTESEPKSAAPSSVETASHASEQGRAPALNRPGIDSQLRLGDADKSGDSHQTRPGSESDPDLMHDPLASDGDISSSASRITIRIACEHCSTVNPVPKTLIRSGVGCVRCGRPLTTASSSSSASKSESAIESHEDKSSASKNRRKQLKRSVEKALLAANPETSTGKLGKVLATREWKELKSQVEAARDADANPASTDAAIDSLRILGDSKDRRAVDYLSSNVESFPDSIRGSAKAALGQLKSPAAFPLLMQSLVDDIPETYADVVRGLGELGDRRATRTLLTIGTYWEELSDFALDAIVKLGPVAVPELLSLADRKDKFALHPFAASALGKLGDPQATTTLATILKSDRRPNARSTAAHSLGQIPDRNVLGPLVSGLKDKDDSVRIAVTEALANHPRKRIVPALVHVLNDPNPSVRANAARLLGSCGVVKALAPLGVVSSDADENVRVAVLEAMARLGDDTAVPQLGIQLSEACDRNNDELITTIATSLGELKDPRAILPLLNAMPKQAPAVQTKIIGALGNIGDPSVVSALVDVIEKGSSPATRVAAVNALGKIGDESAMPALMRALQAGPPMRPAAITALGGITSEEAVSALADLLPNNDPNTRRLAALAIGENGNESVFRKLRPLLDDTDDRISAAALDSLTKLGDVETLAEPNAKSAKTKPKKSKKVKVRKASKRKLQMPSFNFETLQSLTPNDLLTVASEYKGLTTGIAAVAVLLLGGYFFGRSAFNNTFTGGLDSKIIARGTLVDVALGPDGSKIAMSREAGVLDIYDLNAGGVTLDKRGPASGRVVFTNDPNVVLSTGGNDAGRWNLETGEFQPIDAFNSIVFNADHSEFLSLEGTNVMKHNVASGSSELFYAVAKPPGIKGAASTIAATPDFSKVLTGFKGGLISVYVTDKATSIPMSVGVDSNVSALDVSDDGSLLAVGLYNGTLLVLESGAREPLVQIKSKSINQVADVSFIGPEKLLITRSDDTLVVDAKTGETQLEITPACGAASHVSISSDGSRVAFAEYEGKQVAIHNISDGSLVELVEVPNLRR